jgi:hypothetical protein
MRKGGARDSRLAGKGSADRAFTPGKDSLAPLQCATTRGGTELAERVGSGL